LAERNIRYLHSLFRRWIGSDGVSWKKWDELVPFAEAVMRTRPSKKLGVSPHQALMGFDPHFPADHNVDDTGSKLLGKDELWAAARDEYRKLIHFNLQRTREGMAADPQLGNATYPFQEGDVVRRRIKVARRTSGNKEIHGATSKWYRHYTEQWRVLKDHGCGRFLCRCIYPAWPERLEVLDGSNLKKHGAGLTPSAPTTDVVTATDVPRRDEEAWGQPGSPSPTVEGLNPTDALASTLPLTPSCAGGDEEVNLRPIRCFRARQSSTTEVRGVRPRSEC
jgi:hypothetical protein